METRSSNPGSAQWDLVRPYSFPLTAMDTADLSTWEVQGEKLCPLGARAAVSGLSQWPGLKRGCQVTMYLTPPFLTSYTEEAGLASPENSHKKGCDW